MWRLAFALLAAALVACSPPAQRPGPTRVPEPPQVSLLPGRGVQVVGQGTADTETITPQYDSGLNVGIEVVSLTHDGRSTFVVTAVDENDRPELLTQAIGNYTGQRPLVVAGPISFKVTADGNWTLTIQPILNNATANFSGTGDAVSGYFQPPAAGNWSVSSQAQTAFQAEAHCLGGNITVANASGAVQDTPRVEFPKGPCFWEVRSDGPFSLQPQPQP